MNSDTKARADELRRQADRLEDRLEQLEGKR
jgi:ubiquinone biosynthesis protein UbiJ